MPRPDSPGHARPRRTGSRSGPQPGGPRSSRRRPDRDDFPRRDDRDDRDPRDRAPEGPPAPPPEVPPGPDELPLVRLASDRLDRGPWVYGRQCGERYGEARPEPGELVEVQDRSGRFVGHALHNPRSDVRLRYLNRGRRRALERPAAFLEARLRDADRLRRKGLGLEATTDAYRLAHAEGDDLPGLVVDRLGPAIVCEHHSIGFWRRRSDVSAALRALHPDAAILHRVPNSALRAEGFREDEDPEAFDEAPTVLAADPEAPAEVWIQEHGLRYLVRPGLGHKTGWFCDQRDNRRRIGALAGGKHVLDLCTNGGGFALQARAHGARRVVAADLDEAVLELADASARENGLEIELVHADLFGLLRDAVHRGESHDLVVLDPSKWIRGQKDLEDGRRKYLDANALALQACRPGGILATFSCSGAFPLEAFLGTLFAAARRAERGVRLLEVLGPGPDHPQRPDFPRSRYLKGALLAVDGG